MTTLARNATRGFSSEGNRNHLAMIVDIIFQLAAVGLVKATGYARPLVGGDKFGGFATSKADNSAGSAGDIDVEVYSRGTVQLSVSGAVITDINQPVYATDDDTFVFLPTGGTFIGFVRRFVSAGVVEVEFNVEWPDPYGGGVYETISGATKTLDIQDSGKTFFVTVTSVITLPATAVSIATTLVNVGAYGAVQISVDPVAADKVQGPDFTGTDNKDLINTLATAQRGDLVKLRLGHADGPFADKLIGTWATEA